MKFFRLVAIFVGVALVGYLIYIMYFYKRVYHDLEVPKFVLGKVTYGSFVEYFPVAGTLKSDSLVEAEVYEPFIKKMKIGIKASTEINSRTYTLRLSKLDTTVSNRRLHIKFSFCDSIPVGLKHIRLKIPLSDSTNAVMLPVGGFYSDTAGQWILVAKGDTLKKREIKLGRRNPDYFEVIDGLIPGETVVISFYDRFLDLLNNSNEILISDLPADFID